MDSGESRRLFRGRLHGVPGERHGGRAAIERIVTAIQHGVIRIHGHHGIRAIRETGSGDGRR